MTYILFWTVLCVCGISVESLMFKLPPNTQKCLREELRKNHLVVGEFEVSEAPGQKVDYVNSKVYGDRDREVGMATSGFLNNPVCVLNLEHQDEECKKHAILSRHSHLLYSEIVTDSNHEILAQNNDITKGKFTVVVESHDAYEICFKSRAPPDRGIIQEVSFHSKLDEEAKGYEAVGEAQKMKPMEVELKKLESLSQAVVHEFEEMRSREIKLSDTNESTNSRVLYLSIFSMCCLLCLSIWQVLYLRKYFKSRKLIE